MIAEEKLIAKINSLPPGEVDKVREFVDGLLQKRSIQPIGKKRLSMQERADSIERWAKGQSYDTPVILEDGREIIYED
ncbi:MAG TPA: hypothetical protein PKE66_04875 [Pyrinomonadaceae bacterium]|nr:hypothetical protein [Pyrinomonadaceae bacterium]